MADTYSVIRFFQRPEKRKRTVHRGLTLEEAQKHCSNPESSYKTATQPKGRERTRIHGPWFDGYEKE
jgi:hypothetical protein